MTGILTAQNNTSYTTKQVRNITLSTSSPSGGSNGDIWIVYTNQLRWIMATYDVTQTIPSSIKTGDILNCPYSGGAINLTLPKGIYKLEVWGAQGGNAYNSTTYPGGKGGYAAGTIVFASPTTLYLYVGGRGKGSTSKGVQSGGWNGGEAGGYNYGGSGGGGTDIRSGGNALSNRIIVAGAGGGGCYYSGYSGGVGGGSSGGDGTGYSTTYNAKGGTQSAGGAGGSYNGGNYKGTAGSLGTGGAAATSTTSNYGRSGGGGGGYYGGGGGGYRANSSSYNRGQSGGGGGSGYVSATLESTSLIAGNQSMTDYDGSTVTGHSGNGYARITVIKVQSLVVHVNINGVWKEADSMYVNIGGSWKEVSEIHSNIGGSWKAQQEG